MTEAGTRQAVDIAVLKKAQAIQVSTATQLLAGIPPMPNLPAHLGNTIDTKA